MPSLIVFRLIQGIGAGAIQPVGITVVADLYPVHERGKVQGYLASIWGVSSVLGPLAGGLIVRHMGWPWVFWINVPVGLAAAAGFLAFLHEGVTRSDRRVDAAGAALFTVAVAALMAALTEVGSPHGPVGPVTACLCVASAVLFVARERRAADPMLSPSLWTRRPIATANAATLLSGMAIVGLTVFLPVYVQGVLGQSALVAGFALTAMVLGWPIGATLAAKSVARFGLRTLLLFGAALLPTGAVAFVALGPGSTPAIAGLGSVVMGLGMGFLSTAAILIVQGCVGWAERGAATASNIFARNLGSALGAAVLGSVFNLGLARPGTTAVDPDQIRALLDHTGGAAVGDAVRATLHQALHLTFWAVLLVTVLTLVLATLVPSVAVGRGPREVTVD
jgi:MFS family permease